MKSNQIKQVKYISTFNGGLAALFGLMILAGGVIAANFASAEGSSTTSDVSVFVPSACTMRGTGMNSHNDDIANGIYKDNIGTTTFKALCNDAGGFAIYAVGYTGNEIGGTNSDKLVGTSASGNAVIESGTATTAGNPDVSNWAMKLAITQDSGDTTGTNAFMIDSAPNVANPSQAGSDATQASFSDYHVIPNEYTKVAHKNSGTDMDDTTGGIELTSTYAVYISRNQPTDTYSGQVKYTLVHPSTTEPDAGAVVCEPGYICYNANTNDVEGTMGRQTIGGVDVSATLLASNFSRNGYGFAGWSDKNDYATNQEAHFYGPNETIDFVAGQYSAPNNGLSLYAVWVESAGSFQNSAVATATCSSLTTAPTTNANLSSVSALTDERDGNTYAIAKLADGKCWMIENLRLNAGATRGARNQALSQGYNSSFVGLADSEASWGDSTATVANSLYTTETNVAGKNTISGSNLKYRFPRYNNINITARDEYPATGVGANIFSYGNYYSWPAAIADTTNRTSGIYATTSICPTNWQIPIGSSSGDGDYYPLNSLITPSYSSGSAGFRKYPTNYIYSGYIYGNTISSRGTAGGCWTTNSSTGGDYAFDLYFTKTNVYPGTLNDYKYTGFSVRCRLIED